jgi:hypothetical protein
MGGGASRAEVKLGPLLRFAGEDRGFVLAVARCMQQRFAHEAKRAIPVPDNASLYQFRHLPVAVGLPRRGSASPLRIQRP